MSSEPLAGADSREPQTTSIVTEPPPSETAEIGKTTETTTVAADTSTVESSVEHGDTGANDTGARVAPASPASASAGASTSETTEVPASAPTEPRTEEPRSKPTPAVSPVPSIVTSPVDDMGTVQKGRSPVSPSTSSPATSPAPSSPVSTSPSSTSPTTLSPAERPPRRSSLNPHMSSLLTPAPAQPRSPPGAPVKPLLERKNSSSTRVAADLEEFDPLATPAPPVPPKQPKAKPNQQRGETSPSAVPPKPRSGNDSSSPDIPPAPAPATPSSRDEPQFNFAGFLRDLRTKPADPVARYLKSFLTNFARKPFTVNEQIKLIRDFLAFISEKMRIVEPWKSQNEAEFDNALEAMEKLVMNRLYPYTFTPQLAAGFNITTDDLERDAVFAQRVRLFGWVEEKHLDIPAGEQSSGFLAFAEQELLKINHYKAPRDKMICILNCCKVIFGLIRHTQGNEAGADAFVPILIFVVLRANPDNMLSNVEYINRFRNPEKLTGEGGYYLSSLQGAIAFIETMDASSLSNINQEEFESNVEKAIRELPSSPTSPRVESSIGGSSDMSPFATSPGEEPARPLTMPATSAALDGTKRFFQRTGDAAKEAVSRPLSAIGKILDSMQTAGESESGEDSDDERDRASREHEQWQGGQSQSQSQSPGRPHQPQPPSRLLAQLGLSPGTSEAPTPRDRTPTPESYHAAMAQQQAAAYRHQMEPGYPGAYAQQQHQHQQQQQQPYYTPQRQRHQQRQMMQNTLEASHEEYAREQARLANVMTLQQMFPALGEEIVDSVLFSCGDDLGLAIDRLLEM